MAKEEYAVILNFESGKVECLSLEHRESDIDAEDYIEGILEYSLSNCQWMVVIGEPQIERLNF
jgi:hypothetical protein